MSASFQPDISRIMGAQAQQLYASFTPAQRALLGPINDGSTGGAFGVFRVGTAQSTAGANPTSPRQIDRTFELYPVSSAGPSQQQKRKRAATAKAGKKFKNTITDPNLPRKKGTRPLNSWLAFRSYYCKVFTTSQQKDISTFLTHLWQSDPFKAKWTLLAKAYSLVRDVLGGKSNAPLDTFIEITITFVGIIPAAEYLAEMGWEIAVDQDTGENKIWRRFEPDVTRFEERVRAVTCSVEDIIRFVCGSAYMPEGSVGRWQIGELCAKMAQDSLEFAPGESPMAQMLAFDLDIPLPNVRQLAAVQSSPSLGGSVIEQAAALTSASGVMDAIETLSAEPAAIQSSALGVLASASTMSAGPTNAGTLAVQAAASNMDIFGQPAFQQTAVQSPDLDTETIEQTKVQQTAVQPPALNPHVVVEQPAIQQTAVQTPAIGVQPAVAHHSLVGPVAPTIQHSAAQSVAAHQNVTAPLTVPATQAPVPNLNVIAPPNLPATQAHVAQLNVTEPRIAHLDEIGNRYRGRRDILTGEYDVLMGEAVVTAPEWNPFSLIPDLPLQPTENELAQAIPIYSSTMSLDNWLSEWSQNMAALMGSSILYDPGSLSDAGLPVVAGSGDVRRNSPKDTVQGGCGLEGGEVLGDFPLMDNNIAVQGGDEEGMLVDMDFPSLGQLSADSNCTIFDDLFMTDASADPMEFFNDQMTW